LGIGAGDEVIVPSFTFIAAANAIRYMGATPVFVDIDPATLNMDPACVERAVTSRTRALIVVHTFGVPAELDALLAIAARCGLKVIEDACEAIGAEYQDDKVGRRKVGSFGDAGVFAFYPNKQMTTGEGGMVVTEDEAVAEALRSLRNQGRRASDGWFEHSDLGYNYRISEMNCALGLSQLRRIDRILARRAELAAEYSRRLRDYSALVLPALTLPGRSISWFVYVVRLGARYTVEQRDAIRDRLTGQGIGCGRYFAPIHRQPAYLDASGQQLVLPITEAESRRTLALPFFNQLTGGQIDEVCEALIEAIRDEI
jgi:perosamine synthetase